MLPLIKAVAVGLSAINAAGTVRSMTSDAAPATAMNTNSTSSTSTPSSAASAGAGGTAGANASASVAPSGSEIQDRFLKLLVAQMRNQDPLNPLDNAQVTSQLAQLSTVSGVDKLNTTLQSLSSALMASQSMQSASLVGRDVVAAGSRLSLGAGGASAGFELRQPADRVTVNIFGADGALLRKLDLGAAAPGMAYFQWDGLNDSGARVAEGSYRFKVEALRGNAPVTADSLAMGRVNAVAAGNGGVGSTLILDGGIEISSADIKRIL